MTRCATSPLRSAGGRPMPGRSRTVGLGRLGFLMTMPAVGRRTGRASPHAPCRRCRRGSRPTDRRDAARRRRSAGVVDGLEVHVVGVGTRRGAARPRARGPAVGLGLVGTRSSSDVRADLSVDGDGGLGAARLVRSVDRSLRTGDRSHDRRVARVLLLLPTGDLPRPRLPGRGRPRSASRWWWRRRQPRPWPAPWATGPWSPRPRRPRGAADRHRRPRTPASPLDAVVAVDDQGVVVAAAGRRSASASRTTPPTAVRGDAGQGGDAGAPRRRRACRSPRSASSGRRTTSPRSPRRRLPVRGEAGRRCRPAGA